MAEDPDPTKYLFVSLEQKRKDQSKPYDGKKMVWVPDEKECFVLGNIKETKGDMVVVDCGKGDDVSARFVSFAFFLFRQFTNLPILLLLTRSTAHGEEGPVATGEPAQVRKVRGHVQPDLLERRFRVVQPETALLLRTDLHVLGSFLRRHQSVQALSDLHEPCDQDVPGQASYRDAAAFVRHFRRCLHRNVDQ